MIKVFLSYSHKDEALQRELNEHLGALKHEKIIETWWDRQIPTGNNWSEDIARQLEAADLIILLVSSAFLDSTYCYVKEMRRAIERHDAGEARVVPIILRPCYWEPAPFAKIQGLPKDMVPVTTAPNETRDDIWAEVARAIHQAATLCSTQKGCIASENESDGHPSVTITGMRSVDEWQLDSIIKHFKKGDQIGIRWPNSSDQLISLIQQAVKKIDEGSVRCTGTDHFILTAPAALRNALRYRENCERRLPELMCIMSEFGQKHRADLDQFYEFRQKHRADLDQFYRNCWTGAIKYYLLWANFLGHYELGHLSSWVGLSDLDLRAPDAWVPYQGISAEKWVAKLYQLGKKVVRIRLHRIGEYEAAGLQPIYVFPLATDRFGEFVDDKQTICEWAIPQIETFERLALLIHPK
jgi:hypothetical protein